MTSFGDFNSSVVEMEMLGDSLKHGAPPCQAIRVDRGMETCADPSTARLVNTCPCPHDIQRVVFVCQFCLTEIKRGNASCQGCGRPSILTWKYT